MDLQLRDIKARVDTDALKPPKLVISCGDEEIVFLSSDDSREDLAGARRIVDTVWDYQQLMASRRLAAERVEQLAERYGIDPLDTRSDH